MTNPDRQSIIGNIATDGSGDGTGYFQEWVVHQDAVWVDRAGCVHLIDRMPLDYVLNVLTFLYENHSRRIKPTDTNPLVQKLKSRILALAPADEPEETPVASTDATRIVYREQGRNQVALNDAVNQAVRHNRLAAEPVVITVCYRAEDGQVSERRVIPKHVDSRGFGLAERFWLVAYDVEIEQPRSLRLDRIQWVQVPA